MKIAENSTLDIHQIQEILENYSAPNWVMFMLGTFIITCIASFMIFVCLKCSEECPKSCENWQTGCENCCFCITVFLQTAIDDYNEEDKKGPFGVELWG